MRLGQVAPTLRPPCPESTSSPLSPTHPPLLRRALLCVYQLHSAAINSLVVHDSFCVTGSDDKMLRVWPMDFSDYLLEVLRESTLGCTGTWFHHLYSTPTYCTLTPHTFYHTPHTFQAEHEAPVTSVGTSGDGLRVCVGTESGALGVLDIPSQQYRTLLRSHTGAVGGVAADPKR